MNYEKKDTDMAGLAEASGKKVDFDGLKKSLVQRTDNI